MIGLVTDSNSQLPDDLARRFGVEVVPLTVTVDGVEYLEGVDLDADAFYARFAGRTPSVATSQPSPGQFAAAYAGLVDRGARRILSVHVGSAISGTVNSARLAASAAPVPVRVVDSGTASFGVACCVWEAGEVLARGGTLEEAAATAERVGPAVRTVFVVGALELARAGGRLVDAPVSGAGGSGAVPVLGLVEGAMRPVGEAADLDEAADVMAAAVRAAGSHLRAGIGVADAGAAPLWRALEDRLAGAPEVGELVRYRIGPSVGAHTGPGTAGVFFYPSPSLGAAPAQPA